MKAFIIASYWVLVFACSIGPRPAGAAADRPTVTPASGGGGSPVIFGYFGHLDAIGYEREEYFVSGRAHSYETDEPLTEDGEWDSISPAAETAAYTTRVIVHTPKPGGPRGGLGRRGSTEAGAVRTNPKGFNGTVYVEWLNVSGGLDGCPDWIHGHVQAAREGAAFVLVSAQFVGVDHLKNGGLAPGDPERYAPLVHPGDSYSYDIYSQVAQAIWSGDLLGGLEPRRVIAVGESQSAGRLVTYINAVHPLVEVYDGFLVHSRNRGGAALSQDPLPAVTVPRAQIRDDIDAPVIVFQAETDVANAGLLARQPERGAGNFRLWEVAGTAHFDVYGLTIGVNDIGDGEAEKQNLETMQNPPSQPIPGIIECAQPVNTGPMHWVFGAAVHWINRWVTFGTPPPIAPRLETTTEPGEEPVVFAVDEHGNTLGGIRTPFVDVPIAKLTGTGNGARPPEPGEEVPPTSRFCAIFGQTVPFTEAELAELYPSHGSFVSRYSRATTAAVRSGFLMLPDGLALFRAAAQSDIRK